MMFSVGGTAVIRLDSALGWAHKAVLNDKLDYRFRDVV